MPWSYTASGCKSLRLKGSAKWINVNGFCLKQQSGVLCVQHFRFSTEAAESLGQDVNQTSGREKRRKQDLCYQSVCVLDGESVIWKTFRRIFTRRHWTDTTEQISCSLIGQTGLIYFLVAISFAADRDNVKAVVFKFSGQIYRNHDDKHFFVLLT